MRLPLVLAVALVAVSGAALTLASAPAPEHAEVAILDYKYQPATLKIKAGTVVRWTNKEKRVSHSILFTAPAASESERIFPGESWERRFDKPGKYTYTCGPHPEMQGVIEVSE